MEKLMSCYLFSASKEIKVTKRKGVGYIHTYVRIYKLATQFSNFTVQPQAAHMHTLVHKSGNKQWAGSGQIQFIYVKNQYA